MLLLPRALVSLMLVAACTRAVAQAQAPQRTRYQLHAELTEAGVGGLEGTATIIFVNTARAPVDHLVFHLYPNAFEGPHTVFAREGGLALRGKQLDARGQICLLALKTALDEDLLASADDELVPKDRTQLRVTLPRAVAPGAALELRARFRVLLPPLVARMGRAGDFFMLGQWFPKLAKLLPEGHFRSTPYHGTAEFDADFADYDLEVLVPERFVVAAPGKAARPRDASSKAGKRAERYVLERARDIAWAAAPALVHASAKSARGVTIEAFAPRGYSALAARQAQRAAHWLEQLSQWLVPYPYERLVIVIPPRVAHGAAGMEYAGLVTGWSASLPAALPGTDVLHDYVTAHELAHQWFPMLVSSDEVQEPVLDEGLSQWLGFQLLRARYGRAFFDRVLGVPADAIDSSAATLAARASQPVFPFHGDVPSSLLTAPELSARDIAAAIYARPAVVLEAIAAQHGSDRVLSALRRYARDHRFGHATLADLGAAFDAELGMGYSARVLLPALRGQPSELDAHARGAAPGDEPESYLPALFSRALALAQLALGWLGP